MLHDFIDDIFELSASSPNLSSVYIPIFVEPSLFQFYIILHSNLEVSKLLKFEYEEVSNKRLTDMQHLDSV